MSAPGERFFKRFKEKGLIAGSLKTVRVAGDTQVVLTPQVLVGLTSGKFKKTKNSIPINGYLSKTNLFKLILLVSLNEM